MGGKMRGVLYFDIRISLEGHDFSYPLMSDISRQLRRLAVASHLAEAASKEHAEKEP